MIEERFQGRHKIEGMMTNEPLTTADPAKRSIATKAPTETLLATPEITGRVSLFPEDDLTDARRRWQEVQGSFVDDPRTAVRNADELVASLMSRLAEMFANERGKLEKEWDKGEDVSTETLRLALQRYRSFFDRLLSI
jgi:hypothetical protein